MRWYLLLGVLILFLGCVFVHSVLQANASPAWAIDDHVVLEEQDLVVEQNITVMDNGWLDILGTSLRFNCSAPFEYTLTVGRGGRLTIGPSRSGNASGIWPVIDRYPTKIMASWSDSVVIQGLTMRHCGKGTVPAIQVYNVDGLAVRNCEFRDCDIALSVRSCGNVKVEGNRVYDARVRGMEFGTVTNCDVKFNIIERCSVGLEVQYSTGMVVSGNGMGGVGLAGMVLEMDDDITVRSNSIGLNTGTTIEVHYCKLLTIEDQTFSGNATDQRFVSGIMVESSSFVRVRDCDFHGLSEAITIHALFSDREESNLLSGLNISDCCIGINISSVANMVEGCIFLNCPTGMLIGPIYGDPSYGNRLYGCLIIQCDVGVSIGTSRTTTIERSIFTGCRVGIQGHDTTGNLIANCSLSNNADASVLLSNGDFVVNNSTVEGGQVALSMGSGAYAIVRQSAVRSVGLSANLSGGSKLELHNTTHVRAYDVSIDSKVVVYWDVIATTRLESGNPNDDHGIMTVRDSLGTIVTNAQIPSIPWTTTTEILESIRTKGREELRTPHTFMATALERTRTLEVTIDRCTWVNLTIDDVPPRIFIQSPLAASARNCSVSIVGHCRDNSSGHVAIAILLDGEPLLSAEDRWEMTMDLVDGVHLLEYTAKDDGGNEAVRTQRILIDTIPPVLTVLTPPTSPFLVRGTEQDVLGTVMNGTGVSMNGIVLPLVRGIFSKEMELPRDGEYGIDILAWDDLGNNMSLTITIVRDTTPPILTIDEYQPLTRETPLVIGGWTDRDVIHMEMDEEDLPILPGGRFTLIINLVEGPNSRTVTAVDAAGNRAHVDLEITLDTVAVFHIVWPTNGTVVRMNEITVITSGEQGGQYRIGSMDWIGSDDSGSCSIRMTLDASENTITIAMKDRIGNLGEESVVIIYAPPVVYRESFAHGWAMLIVLVVAIGIASISILYFKYTHHKA
jgi:nitrous oxidase accessory protein NosD